MGIVTGSISLRRYRVMGTLPSGGEAAAQIEKAIRAHTLVPLDPEKNPTETTAIGWASAFDEQDLDLSYAKVRVDGVMLLKLRIDTLKPSPADIKRLTKQRKREIEAERKEPLSNAALRELKELITLDLRRKATPKTRTFDVLWNCDERRLYLSSQSKAANEAFVRLFGQTFNIPLDIEGPGFWAEQAAKAAGTEKALRRLRPATELLAGFSGLRPDVAGDITSSASDDASDDKEPTQQASDLLDQRFLGREFLTWLIYHSDDTAGGGHFTVSESFRVLVGERVRLKSMGEGGGEITANGVAPAQTADVRYAIAGGSSVRESSLMFCCGDQIWAAAVTAENFDMRRVKIPSLLSDEDSERICERIDLILLLDRFLREAFTTFVLLRTAQRWQQVTLPAMRRWLDESINAEARPSA